MRRVSPPQLLRCLCLLAAVPAAAVGLVACDQDSYSSTSERDTHMGDVRAAAPAASTSGSAAVPAGSAPAAAAPSAGH